jgi:Domain of unknown function (DUF1330)
MRTTRSWRLALAATLCALGLPAAGAQDRPGPAYYVADFEVADREAIKPYSANVEATFKPFGGLCLPQIKREHIGDAVHQGSDGTECVLLPRRNVISAHPCQG